MSDIPEPFEVEVMAQVIIEDLDPVVIEKLEVLAQQHGRSLQAELKYILETAAQAQMNNSEKSMNQMSLDRLLLSNLKQHLLKNFRPRVERYFLDNPHFQFGYFEIPEDDYVSQRTRNRRSERANGQELVIQSVAVQFKIKATTEELDMLYQVETEFTSLLDEEIKKWSEMVINDSILPLKRPITQINGSPERSEIKPGGIQVAGKNITILREFDLVYVA